MTLQVTSPASILDMAEITGPTSMLNWDLMRECHRSGETFALRAGDELIGVLGLYPIDDQGALEAWFRVRPGAAKHMLAIIRGIRLTLRTGDYRCIMTICRTDQGKRIARASGLAYVQNCDLGEIWQWETSSEVAAAAANPLGKPKSRQNSASAKA